VKKLMDDCDEPEMKEKLDSAMRYLLNFLPGGDGPGGRPLVVLLTSGTFAGGIAHYAANAHRDGVIRFLRNAADRLEARDDVTR